MKLLALFAVHCSNAGRALERVLPFLDASGLGPDLPNPRDGEDRAAANVLDVQDERAESLQSPSDLDVQSAALGPQWLRHTEPVDGDAPTNDDELSPVLPFEQTPPAVAAVTDTDTLR